MVAEQNQDRQMTEPGVAGGDVNAKRVGNEYAAPRTFKLGKSANLVRGHISGHLKDGDEYYVWNS